jgi:hypothetical protein
MVLRKHMILTNLYKFLNIKKLRVFFLGKQTKTFVRKKVFFQSILFCSIARNLKDETRKLEKKKKGNIIEGTITSLPCRALSVSLNSHLFLQSLNIITPTKKSMYLNLH